MSEIVSVKKLTVAYGKNKVIDLADFDISDGDFVCVVGANGSGKSTLIKAMLGLITPAAGEVRFRDGLKQSIIGYLPQETRIDQNFPATVFEIVLSGTLGRAGSRFFYKREDKERANSILNKLGISKLKEKSFGSLSGGQKQKVLLARALTATSDLLILDEPSNNLDYKSRKSFYDILKDLNTAGLTIVMITHDLDIDDLIGNKVLAIKDGKITCETTEDYIRSYR